MKKKVLILSIFIIFIVGIITIKSLIKTNNNYTNDNKVEDTADVIDTNNETFFDSNIIEDNVIINNTNIIKEQDNNLVNDDNKDIENSNSANSEKNNLPYDEGLVIKGENKEINQDLTTVANIAYLLGCENIDPSTDFEKYIADNELKNGIYISRITGYKKQNPYDFVKESSAIMKDMLSSINFNYNIDKNNYLISNNGNNDLEKKINKLINSNKKIIIGFVPEYYIHVNETENEIMTAGFIQSSYVKLKEYKDIYVFLFDFNSSNNDDFLSMVEEITNIDN